MDHPATRLIRRTAREQWRLLALAAVGNLGRALLEGASLGTVFLAVEVASRGQVPAWLAGLQTLGPTRLFVLLILVAVALQARPGAAAVPQQRERGLLLGPLRPPHPGPDPPRILAFSFGYASGYRVGDLTELAAAAPARWRCRSPPCTTWSPWR